MCFQPEPAGMVLNQEGEKIRMTLLSRRLCSTINCTACGIVITAVRIQVGE